MTARDSKTQYRPVDELQLRFYPGCNLRPERIRQLEEDAVSPDELTTDDIVYKLSRMVTDTMYGILEVVEERWGKDVAHEVCLEWARRRSRVSVQRFMKTRSVQKLTPGVWAEFQDYRHLISGPVHAGSFITYEDDTHLLMNRQSCLFHTHRPEGMDSYSETFSSGCFIGYNEAFPEFSGETLICMSRGDSRCQLRFTIRP